MKYHGVWSDDFVDSEYAIYDNETDARNATIELARLWGMYREDWGYVLVIDGEWNDDNVLTSVVYG